MKSVAFKLTVISFVVLQGLNVFARSPIIDPGPVLGLGDAAESALEAMLYATPADLAKFQSLGNTVTGATQRHVKPGVTMYTFTRENCMHGGFAGGSCLGGGLLQVIVTEEHHGEQVSISSKSSVTLYRGLR